MATKVINMCLLLGFGKIFLQKKTHNMVALMLDSHFEGMNYILIILVGIKLPH